MTKIDHTCANDITTLKEKMQIIVSLNSKHGYYLKDFKMMPKTTDFTYEVLMHFRRII